MDQRTIANLREQLFKTLDALADKDKPMEIERAKMICETAQTIINSAKVEVDYMRVSGGTSSGFLDTTKKSEKPALSNSGGKVVHRLIG